MLHFNRLSLSVSVVACAAVLSACAVPQQSNPAPITSAQKGGTVNTVARSVGSSTSGQARAVDQVIQTVDANGGKIKKVPENATSGVKQVVNSASAWNEQCEPMLSQIKVIRPPEHGSLELADFKQVLTKVAGARNCIGKKVEGTNVVYQSNSGFVGTDSFEVSITSPGGNTSVYRHVVNVIPTR